jgi:hypothetical protein
LQKVSSFFCQSGSRNSRRKEGTDCLPLSFFLLKKAKTNDSNEKKSIFAKWLIVS